MLEKNSSLCNDIYQLSHTFITGFRKAQVQKQAGMLAPEQSATLKINIRSSDKLKQALYQGDLLLFFYHKEQAFDFLKIN